MPGMKQKTLLLVKLWRVWRDWVPATLSEEDPGLLLGLIEYADVSAGITQGQLQEKLGIRQSHLSKLTAKLRKEGWIEDRYQEGGDKRVRRILTARKAKAAVKALEDRLSSTYSAARRRKPVSNWVAPSLMDYLSEG